MGYTALISSVCGVEVSDGLVAGAEGIAEDMFTRYMSVFGEGVA